MAGRMKKGIWIPNDVKRIKNIILLFLNTHPAGFNVLCGKAEWPCDAEIREWFEFLGERGDTGVTVQTCSDVYTEQRYVEAGDVAVHRFDALFRHGGVERLREVVKEYGRVYPDNLSILERIGNAGIAGAETIDAIAESLNIDIRTLRRRQDAIAEDIACGIYYAAEDAFVDVRKIA